MLTYANQERGEAQKNSHVFGNVVLRDSQATGRSVVRGLGHARPLSCPLSMSTCHYFLIWISVRTQVQELSVSNLYIDG